MTTHEAINNLTQKSHTSQSSCLDFMLSHIQTSRMRFLYTPNKLVHLWCIFNRLMSNIVTHSFHGTQHNSETFHDETKTRKSIFSTLLVFFPVA